VYHSADRGRTWTVSDTPLRAGVASAGVFSVAFRDARHGAISGGDYEKPGLRGRNFATTADGGLSWTLTDSAASPAGYRSAVAFVPRTRANTLVAVGLTGTDVSTDDGLTWKSVDSTAYNSVAFASPTAGWAVGPKGRIARWTGAVPDRPPVTRGATSPKHVRRASLEATAGGRAAATPSAFFGSSPSRAEQDHRTASKPAE
jgi:photosystem II stability/assembly factor-like uncharacterized protein